MLGMQSCHGAAWEEQHVGCKRPKAILVGQGCSCTHSAGELSPRCILSKLVLQILLCFVSAWLSFLLWDFLGVRNALH